MMFWRKKDISKNPFYDERDNLVVYLRCNKCGEVFMSHIRKTTELFSDYANNRYVLNKEYIGSKCPNRIRVHAVFKPNYKLESFEIEGGSFITKEEYWKEVEGEKPVK